MYKYKASILRALHSAKFYTIALIAFTLPVGGKIIPPMIVTWLVLWLMEGNFKAVGMAFRANRALLLISALYFLHVIGLLYTSNMQSGLFDLEVKLSLLLLPILSISHTPFNAKEMQRIGWVFVIGNALAAIYCISRAAWNLWHDEGDISNFYYTTLSAFLHPTYFTMYLSLSLFFVLTQFKMQGRQRIAGVLSIFIIILLTTTIVLLFSKAGTIAFVICILLFVIGTAIQSRSRVVSILVVIGVLLGSIGVFKFNFRFRQMQEVLTELFSGDEQNSRQLESSSGRVVMLRSAVNVAAKNWMVGVGTGDVKDAVVSEYIRNNAPELAQQKLNPHNQFLEIWIALGLPGLLLTLLLFIWPLLLSIRSKQTLGIYFIVICAVNFVFESILNTQAGVIFFAYFYSYCFIIRPEKSIS